MSKDEDKFDALVEQLSLQCIGYEITVVLPAAMCISEQAIRTAKKATSNFTEHLTPDEVLGYQLTAQRLEYLAQLLRGEDAPDPHENVVQMIQAIQEQSDETTH